LTAAEHLEAALRLLGFDQGAWLIELDVAAGRVRRMLADPRGVRISLNRVELESGRPPAGVGESTA
jgi:hypothetical protein